MDWNIEPYIGVGQLKFGMSHKEVEELLGAAKVDDDPVLTRDAIMAGSYEGYYTESRILVKGDKDFSQPVLTYLDGKLNTIELWDTHETLNLNGLYFFKQDMGQAIKSLIEQSDVVLVDKPEGYLFMDYGLSLYNEEYYESGEPIAVFARGEFDDYIEEGLEDDTLSYLKGDPR